MGSGTSRGKKVAPVSDVNGTKTAAGVASSKQDSRSFMPLKIHSILRTARSRAQADCHSEGHDSDISGEEDGIDEDLDTVLAGHEERRVSAKKSPTKKTFIRSKTYGLCHFSRADTDEDSGSASRLEATAAAEEPRGSQGAVRHVNKRSNDASAQSAQHTVRTFNSLVLDVIEQKINTLVVD